MNLIFQLIFASLFIYAPAINGSSTPKQPSLNDFSWLAGCHETKSADSFRDEYWSAPKGGMMIGVGRQVKDGKVSDFEFMKIYEAEDGLYFSALVKGEPAEFILKLETIKNGEAVFKNIVPGFPERVTYRKTGNSFYARVEGSINNKQEKVEFSFNRARCAQ